MGKEFAVFGYRLQRQQKALSGIQFLGKMNGAVGNYNAHRQVFPQVPWQ